MEKPSVKRAAREDLAVAAELAQRLWPHDGSDELAAELREHIEKGGAVFLAYVGGAAAGFAQCSLRRDYVEGTAGSPVGYLEGIYVVPRFRRSGTAAALLAECEQWASAMGCAEFAIDCETDNADSIAFHLGAGFTEAARIICFTKRL